MAAVVQLEWRHKTLRELFVQYQAVLLETWHHTARIQSAFSTEKVPYEKLHPYFRSGSTQHPSSIPISTTSLFTETLQQQTFVDQLTAAKRKKDGSATV